MLNVVMLNVVMLSVVMLNAVMYAVRRGATITAVTDERKKFCDVETSMS
jgi:hypothetical protein